MCGGQGAGWPALSEEECGGRCGECPGESQRGSAKKPASAPMLRERCGWCKDEDEALESQSKSTVAKANAWLSAAERVLKSTDRKAASLGFAHFSRLAMGVTEQARVEAARGLDRPFMKLSKQAKKDRKEAFTPRESKRA